MRAKLPCGHDDMCGVCHLRLRFLHDDKKCPICKQSNDTVIVDSDDTKTFDSYPRWGDEIGAGFVYKADVGMFFAEKYYQKSIVPLYEFSCSKCEFKIDENVFVNQHIKDDDEDNEGNGGDNNKGGKKKKRKPLRILQDHMRKKHRLSMCQLCIDHKRDFVSQLPKFTPNQLQNHLKNGDGLGSGFSGHPICEFCRPKRFYDVNYLHQHLHKEHYKCHICEKQGLDNQWFKNYNSLARHFDKQHFMCHSPQCQAARFVVFENELDLRAHEISVHGGTSTGSTKINLEFNIRRSTGTDGERRNAPSEADFNYALDGQAFVPPALANDNNSSHDHGTSNNANTASSRNHQNNEPALHPQHVQRTEEFRAQAAAVRQLQALNTQEESFPTLQNGAAQSSSSAPLVGWTSGTTLQNVNRSNSRNVGQITREAFPSLQSNSSKQNNNKKAMKGSVAGARRQFAAMTTSANQKNPSWGGNDAASASIGSIPPAPSSGNFYGTPTPARQLNRQADLAPNNFPSLGGPSSSTYAAANSLAIRNLQQRTSKSAPPPSLNSATDFPSMQGNGRYATTSNSNSIGKPTKKNLKLPPSIKSAAEFPSMQGNSRRATTISSNSITKPTKNNLKPPPSMKSISDFPAPPSAKQSAKPTVRGQILGDSNRKIPAQNNVLRADLSLGSAGVAKATVEDMKASLGQKNFKQLKKLTKTFAQEALAPEGYIDQCSELFEKGYEDLDFWSYLPSLLESCPNQGSAQHALKYMNSLKRQQFESDNIRPSSTFATSTAAKGASSQWNGNSSNKSNVMRKVMPPPPPAYSGASRSLTQQVAGATLSQTMPSKKKATWGAGGKATIVRTKALPGSVGSAAAVQGPKGGSGTKFMAKEQKQHAKNNNNNNNPQQQKKGKKKKQKNELRDLAFGR
eukprot:CAMPEP_0168176138 /NCGR_PEP_ID=MMETSP0139_2-20121125/7587_1 /TAXON_ID=44445 /ORGANISM="Pseudo-nitzschia australis, Strain 10249 10 AB" /LENGTH=909 /DNA_ID=CAMNT_0008094755 /DNA_START=271 /DNA_END=3000 /DNA_ORIENTATION=-